MWLAYDSAGEIKLRSEIPDTRKKSPKVSAGSIADLPASLELPAKRKKPIPGLLFCASLSCDHQNERQRDQGGF
jgi:hypothetical protein